ncbi:helix-turn-helix domain-containing protein [Janibacter massiliensis]|uniref:helix-turn-helix domain-containing protein n=1 Tax=Janibacter massiliensis TaxID=2058291 RepID=UPI000D0FACF3|nr:helix-turn-helix transcriptional regulator [Janibacter massiliensis]
MERTLSEPWATRLVERGFTDPRYTHDVPSLSRLAEACGMHTSTVSAAIKGTGRKPSAETVAALVRELGDDVAGWLGEATVRPWSPPAEASLLTDRQRRAVEELIRSMAERPELGEVRPRLRAVDGRPPTGIAARSAGRPGDADRARLSQDQDAQT